MVRNTILLIISSILLVACAISMDQVRAGNRQKLLYLSTGITRAEVLEIMGTETITAEFGYVINNPYGTEMYRASGHTFELLLYYTDKKKADGAITDDELTPIVILDGKVDRWG